MQRFRLLATFIGMFVCIWVPATAAESPVLNEDWAVRLADVDGIMRESVEQGVSIGVEALVIKDNEILLHRAYGVEDVDTGKSLSPGAIWSVKSMTKPLVALAVLMLVDEGKVSLNEPIATWLPDFAGDRRVTVSDLLSHKSGVAGLGGSAPDHQDFRKWVETWANRSPAGPMGQFRYSDFNFAVAALIIADRSDMTVEEFISSRILSPLGMTDSYLTYDPSFEWATRVPSRYVKRDGVFEEVWDQKEPIWYPFFPGGWGLWASARDYAKFMQFWLDRGSVEGRQLIGPTLIDLALTPHTRQVNGAWSYGLGWKLHGANADRSRPLAFHHGGYDGTRAYAYPATRTIALVLTHSRGSELLGQSEDKLIAVRDLGAKSPRVELVEDLDWKPLDAELTAVSWVGEYSGTAYVNSEGHPVKMTIIQDGNTYRWMAKIETPSGVRERSALFVAESEQRGWLARERKGAPFYLLRDRQLTLNIAGRLVLKNGESILADVEKQP
jgi:CubicO group peptidase (beta-lactamase class C family)